MKLLLRKAKYFLTACIEHYGLLGFLANILSVTVSLYSLIGMICKGDFAYSSYVVCSSLLLICILVNYHDYRKHSVKLDDLYYHNVPLLSTMTYLIRTRNVLLDNRNELVIESLSVNIRFDNCQPCRNPKDVFIEKQSMNYCLTAINKTKQAVFRYELAQIHSLYTSSSQLNFMTSCRLQPTDQPIPVSTELKKTSSPLINMV